MLRRIFALGFVWVACGDSDGAERQVDAAVQGADVSAAVDAGSDGTAGTGTETDANDDIDASVGEAATGDDGDLGPGDVAGATEGTPCTSDEQCRSGWCVPSAIGEVCVALCDDGCQPGEACIEADRSGTDPVFLCVPFVTLPGDDTSGGEVVGDGGADGADSGDGTSLGDVGPGDDATTDDATSVADGADGGSVTPTDTDGDGIPDDEDHLPCLAIYLIVFNTDVTSASLTLNGVEVVPSSSFPTSDSITVPLNPVTGDNTLSLGGKLTGSPSDSMTLVVVDAGGVVYFSTVITREHGKPSDETYTFVIDATCP